MKDKKFNISKPFNTGDYMPDISDDEGWEKMADILDKQMPVSSFGKGRGKFGSKFWRSLLVIFLLIVFLLSWILIRNKTNRFTSTSTVNSSTKDKKNLSDWANINQPNPVDINSHTTIDNTNKNSGDNKPTRLATNSSQYSPVNAKQKTQLNKNRNKLGFSCIGIESHNSQSNTRYLSNDNAGITPELPEKAKLIIPASKRNYVYQIMSLSNNAQKIADLQKAKSSLVRSQNRNKDDEKKFSAKTNSKNVLANFHFGLEWNTPIPLQSVRGNYFVGGNGKNEAYMTLIPGIWVSKTFGNRHEITAQFKPYQQNFPENVPFAAVADMSLPTPHTRSYYLLKTTGKAANIQYKYYVSKKWGVNTGMALIGQRRALVNEKLVRDFDQFLESDTTYSIFHNAIDTVNIKKSAFVAGKVGLFYNISNKLQIGAETVVPFSNLSAFPQTSIRPVNGQFFIRWRIK